MNYIQEAAIATESSATTNNICCKNVVSTSYSLNNFHRCYFNWISDIQIMASSFVDLTGEDDILIEPRNNHHEITEFPQALVTEKIIFCVDNLTLTSPDDKLIYNVFFLLKSYFTIKKKISVKHPEFEFLLIFGNDTIYHSHINTIKDLQAAFSTAKSFDCEEEKEPLQIDKVFDRIAEIVELPDPEYYNKCLPPTNVYHVIWLFGCNLYIPTMENTNSFDYLMMSPYVAIDILYIYDKSNENNLCEHISQCLLGLNENGKGYFLSTNVNSKSKFFSCFSQILGNPLIRPPQSKANYNIKDLGPQQEIVKEDNNVE